jgi:hypothetical protein
MIISMFAYSLSFLDWTMVHSGMRVGGEVGRSIWVDLLLEQVV